MRGAALMLPIAMLAACRQHPSPVPGSTHRTVAAAPAPAAVPAPRGPLGAYVGRYPPDKVDGRGFLDHPLVRAGVHGAVSDPAIRAWILDKAGPQTPIVLEDGKILSWGCQAHLCGPHNWTVSIAPDGTGAEVCYLDMDARDASGWYAAGVKKRPADHCPAGDDA